MVYQAIHRGGTEMRLEDANEVEQFFDGGALSEWDLEFIPEDDFEEELLSALYSEIWIDNYRAGDESRFVTNARSALFTLHKYGHLVSDDR